LSFSTPFLDKASTILLKTISEIIPIALFKSLINFFIGFKI
jgi:hypothetical protein